MRPNPSKITYRDIYELLCKELAGCDVPKVLLLGSHGPEQNEDGLLKEAVRRIVEGWPPPPFRISGRDEGRSAENFWLRPADKPGSAFRKAFESVLRKCGVHAGRGPAVYRRQVTSSQRTVETVLPNARDRRIPALRSFLGHAPLFYRSELSERRPRPLRVPIVHLYLDVSGSMTECLPYLSAACREPFKRGELKIFAFSTVVSELKGHDLSKAPMRNTWGTDINAVLEHVTSHSCEAPAEGHLDRHRRIRGARSQRPDCQARSHPGGGCPDSPRACRRPPTMGPRNDPTSQTMNQHAEYVSPGHPDRLADAIAESIVTAAVRQKPDALVGVEVAVHTDCVFVDGRIAAGSQPVDIEKIVRDVYRAAGYGGSWNPDPGKIRVTTELCEEVLPAEESDIRPFSDDQNIVIGYACGDERTNYLPAAHWISGELGRRLFARLRSDADLSATFGPDFKILASLGGDAGRNSRSNGAASS